MIAKFIAPYPYSNAYHYTILEFVRQDNFAFRMRNRFDYIILGAVTQEVYLRNENDLTGKPQKRYTF